MAFELPENLSPIDAKAYDEARKLVNRLERQHGGDLNKVMGAIVKAQGEADISKRPTSETLFNRRVTELAGRYAHVSDGNMGVDHKSNPADLNNMVSALRGQNADGGILPSQSAAIAMGRTANVSTANLPRLQTATDPAASVNETLKGGRIDFRP